VKLRASRKTWLTRVLPLTAAAALVTGGIIAIAPTASAATGFELESLDGGGNNQANPTWGQAGRAYARVGTAHYADGISQPVSGPNARYISNRIINDRNTDVFDQRRITQFGWAWGQFLDHTFGLRDGGGSTATPFNIAFNAGDPLEEFTNNLGTIAVNRSAATAGTGTSTSNPRQQTNTITSYISAQSVYSSSPTRLDWLRAGPVDGNPANNSALLLLSNNFLPKATARGNAATAPVADVDGRLAAHPQDRRIAGDPRANENIGLTALHTVFAREHNRIVNSLPSSLSQEDKFQIARRVVIAEEQYITYSAWLPAMGIALPQYTGYKNNVNATISNEFATMGYRVHSQIHGEFEIEAEAGQYTQAQLDQFRALGAQVEVDATGAGVIAVPASTSNFNPDLLEVLGVGPMLLSEQEQQYNNDETIDNQLRSVLFQVPSSQNPDCLNGPTVAQCYNTVMDLGAIDIQRGRDHGLGTYNQLRAAYGLSAKNSFTAITGENTESFPAGTGIDNPNSIDIVALFDIDGKSLDVNNPQGNAVRDVKRTTLAARLKGIYGSTANVDAFVGAFSEPHVPGTSFGETNLAIWTKQFQALRDGDRFFFENDLSTLNNIKSTYGIDFRTTLGQLIGRNTDANTAADLHDDVFLVAEDDLPAATCSVNYDINRFAPNLFEATIKITNNTDQFINGWTLRYQQYQGQNLQLVTGAIFTQGGFAGRDITATSVFSTALIQPHTSETAAVLRATFDGELNAIPPNFTLNNRRCDSNHH
jgi:Animal haem peroxidase/Cellulose binding domain